MYGVTQLMELSSQGVRLPKNLATVITDCAHGLC